MASRVRRTLPCLEATEPERPPPALTSDLLEEIFLRVASPADLARASTACTSFRHLISDPSFLRRYRSIHPPLFLGFVDTKGFEPVEAPHPSAAVASAVARAADFSFDFLPRPAEGRRWQAWHPHDVRDVLEGRVEIESRWAGGLLCSEFVVCDPLSRRYLLLPPVTDELLASVELESQNVFYYATRLVPSEGTEDTSFRVIRWMESDTRLGAFIFSSVSGCWSPGASISWNVLGLDDIKMNLVIPGQCMYHGFYWKQFGSNVLIKLDMNTMQFCTIDLPPGHDQQRIFIVESVGSNVTMFSMTFEGTFVDYYTFSQNGSEKSHEWHMMSTIPLPADYRFYRCIKGPAEGYIFLEGMSVQHDANVLEFFSLEIKSLKIERVSTPRICSCDCGLYFGFPPSMSPRRMQGYEAD